MLGDHSRSAAASSLPIVRIKPDAAASRGASSFSDACWQRAIRRRPRHPSGGAIRLGRERPALRDGRRSRRPGFAGPPGERDRAPAGRCYTATASLQTLQSPTTHQFEVVARLTPGVTVAAAKSDMVNVGRVRERDVLLIEGTTVPWRAAAYTLQELRVDPHARSLGGRTRASRCRCCC